MNSYLSPVLVPSTHVGHFVPPARWRRNESGTGSLAIVAAALVWLATSGWAGIFVDPAGSGTLTFDARPAATNWSTRSMGGAGAGDIGNSTQMNTVVQTNSASLINTVLGSTATVSPAPTADALSRWNSANLNVQTCPTSVGYSVLMATLLNNTGNAATGITIEYDLGELNAAGATVAEELAGHQVFYSLSGAPNSWTLIPALSGIGTPGRLSATVSVGTWPAGGTLYVLWADDNAAANRDNTGNEEGCYTLDNVVFTAVLTNLPLSLALTSPNDGQHWGLGTAMSASVALTGSPTNVSYYVDGGLAVERTAAPFTPVTLPALGLGTHSIYATARDTSNTFVTTVTNTFVVDISLSGTLSGDTTLYASNSPYTVSGSLTVPSGVTLTIEPGVTLQFNAGQSLSVATGGRLLAEGNETNRIRFTRAPGATSWGSISITGDAASPETRIRYAHLEYHGSTAVHSTGGTLWLDHLTFGTADKQYLALDASSFVVSDCHFPAPTASLESVHGAQGIKAGGRAIFIRNFFGAVNGYSDTIDFTGGNRPGPIVQFINNVFMGSGDDNLDLDSTDAWVEGNLFLHVHKNGSPDTSSAVSGGADNADTSQVTVIGNIMYDCDHAAMCKQGNFFTLLNNTIVRQTHTGGLDTEGAVVCLQDNNMAEGAGMYLEGNIILDAEKLTRNVTSALVTYTNNGMTNVWAGPGGGNWTNDPMLNYIPQLSETVFTNWQQAQIMWQWFGLQSNSPARAVGPDGRDAGGVIGWGVSVSGEPLGTTTERSASLAVGVNRSGSGMPTAGWPNGAGFTHYRWRLDTNAWSAETALGAPITLSGLADGAHQVEVIGKSDAGFYQNDPIFGADAVVTATVTWHVQSPFRATPGARTGNHFTLQFPAAAGNDYSVLYRDALDPDHPWSKLLDVAAPLQSGPVQVTDSNAPPGFRFYRVVTPAAP
jgi:hypothetical protein